MEPGDISYWLYLIICKRKRIYSLIILIMIIFLVIAGGCRNNVSSVAPLPIKNNTEIPVLAYHNLSEKSDEWDSDTVSPDKFKEEMLYLKALGFNTIHLSELAAYKEGKANLPENPIIVTFDDGYESNYIYAFPIMQKLGMKFTICVIGNNISSPKNNYTAGFVYRHFTFAQMSEMYKTGLVEFQNHTYDLHNPGDVNGFGKGIGKLKNETDRKYMERLSTDFMEFNKIIKNELGYDPIALIYPYGIYNDLSEAVAEQLGFKATLTLQEGINNVDRDGLYLMKRISMPYNITSINLIEKILKYLDKKTDIPYKNIGNPDERIKELESMIDYNF